MDKQITKTSADELKEFMQSVSDPDPDKRITATILSMATDATPPDTITPDLLAGAKKKVDNLEFSRPDMVKDPEKLGNYITWNYQTASAYRDYVLLLSLKISSDTAERSDCGNLKKDLELAQKRLKALDADNKKAWDLFRGLKEGRGTPEELNGEAREAPIISIGAKKIKKVKYPVDKLNRDMWNPDKMQGRRSANFKVEKSGSEKMIDIPLSLDFSKVEEVAPQVKELTEYQKRVWILSDALYRAGNNIISFDQIYKYTGRERKLSEKKDIDEINDAFSALNVEVALCNKEEIDAGYKYSEADYHGAILPNKRIRDYEARILINGKETHGAIKILDKSDLLDFAIDRGQVAEVPVEVFQTPYQKTDQEIKLEDYFLTWIIRGLDSNKPKDRKRKLSTLYKEFHITTAKTNAGYKKRERFQIHIVDLLNFYAKQDLIINDRRLTGCELNEYDELRLKYKKVPE